MKVAIVGSGVSGLSAAWLLNEHSDHEVTLYEKNGTVGGHTNTIDYFMPANFASRQNCDSTSEEDKVAVDTGFIVLNELNYPNFLNFLNNVGVEVIPSKMTFSVSKQGGLFEWAGENLRSLFCQAANLTRPRFYRMIYDILKFNFMAPHFLTLDLEKDPRAKWTLEQYLKANNYGPGFIEDYLIPMSAAIWSTPPDTCIQKFLAYTAIQFMANHCLLQVEGRPQWLTIKGGSRNYVQRILSKLGDVRVSCPVKSITTEVTQEQTKAKIQDCLGGVDFFDHVIIATHADEALELLGSEASSDEKEILKNFSFSHNHATVHCDETLMPVRKLAWSSWNYLDYQQTVSSHEQSSKVSLTYWMNILQSIDSTKFGNIFVTLNSAIPPRKETVFAEFDYTHPVFTVEAIMAQERLPLIQSPAGRPISFAGAWQGYGFHEDGFRSGAREACRLGAQPPFKLVIPPRAKVDQKSVMVLIQLFIFFGLDFILLQLIFPLMEFLFGEGLQA